MDDNSGGRQNQDEFERRLFQALALLERAGEQRQAAAATLARLGDLERRVNQAIEAAGAEAARRIAEEARGALDHAIAEAADRLRQASRIAVAAAEHLRLPWQLNLAVILLAGLLGAAFSFWAAHRADRADFQQNQRNQQLIQEGRMLERVWPKLSPPERKKIERLDSAP